MWFKRVVILFALALTVVSGTAALAQVNIGFGAVTHDANEPIEVTSDSLAIDQTSGEAVFSGNVVVVQGSLRLSAGEVIVRYDEAGAGRSVEQVIASGGVLVARGEDAAEGAEAVYRVAESMLTLTGDVLVTQGPTAISGDRMVVNMATGDGTVDGRVRTVLAPGESDE